MASSRITNDEVKLLICPICSETLQSPRILPCLHTFCEKCIHELILSISSQKETQLEFSCPICRTPVNPSKDTEVEIWASSLPKNVIASTMIAAANGIKQECHACQRQNQKSDATVWCKDCEEALCEKCNAVHSKLKFCSTHAVVTLENIESNTPGIDLSGIREECSIHPTRKLEAYCLDHDILCCIQCITLTHKHCRVISDLKDIPESFENPKLKLISIKEAIEKLVNLKEQHINDFSMQVDNTEDDASKFKELVKYKLDELFQTFTKQLHVSRDEHIDHINIQVRLLKQFISSVQHWIETTEVIEENGSKNLLFVHMNTVKQQIKTSVEELNKDCRHDQLVRIRFKRNEILDKVSSFETFGDYVIDQEKLKGQLDDIDLSCRCLGIRIFPTFDNITVKKAGIFRLSGSNICCGVAVGRDTLLLGDKSSPYKLHLYNTKTSSIKTNVVINGHVKSVCYDEKYKNAFIACHGGKLYKAVVGEQIEYIQRIESNNDYIGALCVHGDFVYIASTEGINKIPSTADHLSREKLSLCFKTNTSYKLNGLDICNSNIIYITKDSEVKSSTLNGKEVFCYKHDEIKKPVSLVILSSGLILILDNANGGMLHVVSSDGSKHRTILTKLEKIDEQSDVWLDVDEEIVYVAGGEYIEAFQITTE